MTAMARVDNYLLWLKKKQAVTGQTMCEYPLGIEGKEVCKAEDGPRCAACYLLKEKVGVYGQCNHSGHGASVPQTIPTS
jgi:hypothetical protein